MKRRKTKINFENDSTKHYNSIELLTSTEEDVLASYNATKEKNPSYTGIEILSNFLNENIVSKFALDNSIRAKKAAKTAVCSVLKKEIKYIINETTRIAIDEHGMDISDVIKEIKGQDYINAFGKRISNQTKEMIEKEIDLFCKIECEKLEESSKNNDNVEKEEENIFYNKVKKYTNNFKFLAEDRCLTKSFYGKSISDSKFDNLEQWEKFKILQKKVQTAINISKDSEEKAIKMILSNKKLKVSDEERKILESRVSVLSKEDIEK